MLGGRQILSKDIRNFPLNLGLGNRINNDSRKGRKGGGSRKFSLRSWRLGAISRRSDKLVLALWNSASGEQLDLGRVGIPRGSPREIPSRVRH